MLETYCALINVLYFGCILWIQRRVNKLDVQERLVNIAKGGTRNDEYKAMNPLCKVPYFQVRFIYRHMLRELNTIYYCQYT